MTAAELGQLSGLLQPQAIVALLAPVLHQRDACLQSRLHPFQHRAAVVIRTRIGNQAELGALQLLTPMVVVAGLKDAHFVVVERVTHRGGCGGQGGVCGAGKLLDHPQGFLHTTGIGLHHLAAVGACLLRRVA